MTSTPVAPDVCHDNKLWCLQNVKRFSPKIWAHQPLVVAWLPADPLPEPSESYESNEKSIPAHFEGLSHLILPPPHLLGASDDVGEGCMVVADPHLHHTSV
jgi:hypothetical protein